MIDHLDLSGLRQGFLRANAASRCLLNRSRTPLLYKIVRHPLMLGFSARILGHA